MNERAEKLHRKAWVLVRRLRFVNNRPTLAAAAKPEKGVTFTEVRDPYRHFSRHWRMTRIRRNRDATQIARSDATMANNKRRRCDNPACGKQYRPKTERSQYCLPKCRQAVYVARQAREERGGWPAYRGVRRTPRTHQAPRGDGLGDADT